MPARKFAVPSIGSITQRFAPISPPSSSPKIASSGKSAAIAARNAQLALDRAIGLGDQVLAALLLDDQRAAIAPLRFLFASYPELMGIVYRTLATHIIHKAGFTKSTAYTGTVTLIQRFGSALNLNVHLHMLYLDGVYAEDAYGKVRWLLMRFEQLEQF